MKRGKSYRNLSFVIHNLLTFAFIIGLQNHFLYTITTTITAVAEDLPQAQAVVEATATLFESLQFNAFDSTHKTFAASPSSSSSPSSPSSSSSSSPLLSSSTSTSLAGLSAVMQEKLSSPSVTSATAYPTSTKTTAITTTTKITMSDFHNTKTSKIMSNVNSISPTQTINILQTTFRTRSTSSRNNSRNGGNSNNISGKTLVNKSLGKLQTSTYTPTPSSGLNRGVAKKSKNNIKSSNSDATKSQSSSFHNSNQHEQQDFPLDFSLSKKTHWTNADAAFNGGVDADVGDASSGGNVNFRLASLSSVTAAASSSSSSLSLSSFSSSTTETERPRIFRNKHHHERHWGPFFEEPLNSTTSGDNSITTAHLYTEAVLNCRVGMLKDKTVMWVRRTSDKVSLLTVGNVTYSSDPRIRVKFQYPNNWRLLINPTQWDDAGIYMCQVSTHPPRVFTTNLTVIEPPLRLIDDQERDVGDRYYKTGSTIDLQCQVSRSFLYKEKQNILKSLKPLNIHNDSHANSSNASSHISTATSGSSSSFHLSHGQNNNSGGAGGASSNILNAGYSNNNNKHETKMAANKNNNNNKYASSAPSTSAITSLASTTSSHGFGVFSNNLLQNINQSTTSVDKPEISLEQQQLSDFVFWSKDDETLPLTALKRTSSNDKWFTSRVTITDAKLTDSGNYSCSIGRMFMAIVQVQVLTGELPAAVQHNSAATGIVFNVGMSELILLYWIYITAAASLLY